MARVRVHQHVNPLAPFYRFRPKPLEIASVFEHPELPLHVDLGCARGRFLLKMARLEPARNFLGVEIREPLVEEANRIGADEGLTNLHYEFCNAMLELDTLLARIPAGRIDVFTIQFPDPWFKKKHAKRRMVNEQLVQTVAEHLSPGGRAFVQTDIDFLADEMFELFRGCASLKAVECAENPFPVKTEREQAVEEKELAIHRRIFLK
ncbi:MAG: tRNA (guanosine(46)-N7)-methyltransferase TrmB [Acidobacteria bacterium]|nr:tRNA (guanosine(46)-N7)-methyltransferase TrmB [Acidobacteriota bacterium]